MCVCVCVCVCVCLSNFTIKPDTENILTKQMKLFFVKPQFQSQF